MVDELQNKYDSLKSLVDQTNASKEDIAKDKKVVTSDGLITGTNEGTKFKTVLVGSTSIESGEGYLYSYITVAHIPGYDKLVLYENLFPVVYTRDIERAGSGVNRAIHYSIDHEYNPSTAIYKLSRTTVSGLYMSVSVRLYAVILE